MKSTELASKRVFSFSGGITIKLMITAVQRKVDSGQFDNILPVFRKFIPFFIIIIRGLEKRLVLFRQSKP